MAERAGDCPGGCPGWTRGQGRVRSAQGKVFVCVHACMHVCTGTGGRVCSGCVGALCMHVYREGSAASCMPVCTCLSRVVGLTWSLGKLAPEHPQPPDPPSESPASAWPPPPGHPRLPLGVNGMSQRARGLPLDRLPLPTQEECQDGRGPWTVGTVQGGHKGRGPGDSLGVGRTGPDVWQIPVAGTLAESGWDSGVGAWLGPGPPGPWHWGWYCGGVGEDGDTCGGASP